MILMMDLSFQTPFCENFLNPAREALKSFDLSFKKDVPYFKMNLARCPHCETRQCKLNMVLQKEL